MTRILLVGDIHVSDRPPARCTDSYTDDIIDMLMYVAKLEKDLQADAVVWAGDIFHHKQPSRTSHATVLKMLAVVRSYTNLYIVTGNHDISNDVLDSVHEKQPLGVLLHAGAHELNGWHPELPIFGVPWQQRWLHEDTPREALAAWREAENSDKDLDHALVVTHAPIYPPATRDEQMFDLVPTAGAQGLSEAMGHKGYLYYGHIHEDHGIFEDEGVTYANMGAISRGSLNDYNLEREIKVAVWQDFPNASYQRAVKAGKPVPSGSFDQGFTEIQIPHKPATEVFKIEEAKAEKAAKLSLDQFLSEVGSSTLDITSTEGVIEHIKALQVEPPVKKKSIELLENAS